MEEEYFFYSMIDLIKYRLHLITDIKSIKMDSYW